MSLTKLLKAPIRLFKKDVISFLIIRRHDIGNNKLHYISVKQSSSISVLRQKLWHLLDLPDFCEEIIVLKSGDDTEIPLTDLRKGNDPQRPYIVEVYLPKVRMQAATIHNKNIMLTMGNNEDDTMDANLTPAESNCNKMPCLCNGKCHITASNETIALNKHRILENKQTIINLLQSDCKRSDLSCGLSNSSIFSKLNGRRSRDNFISVLVKIQNDLSTLSNKLSSLETRIPA